MSVLRAKGRVEVAGAGRRREVPSHSVKATVGADSRGYLRIFACEVPRQGGGEQTTGT